MSNSFTFSSNSIRLSWKHWAVALVIILVIVYLLPVIWQGLEEFGPSTDYRLPYLLSDDYWMFTRWSKHACSEYPFVVVGDSVVWGQYVAMDGTLSYYLNEKSGEDIFANLGVDGTHPAAILGLVKHFGKAISNKRVLLHLNPLWMTSKRHDLSGDKEFRLNHPRLVPQFIPNLACYNPTFAQRVSVAMERKMRFFSWTRHIRANYFENMDIGSWAMENPYRNPLKAITLEIPVPENQPKSRPVSWTERGAKKQNFQWVQAEESFQWSSFKRVIKTLKARNNNIFVLLGPFNPYILTDESLNRYNGMKNEMESWLEDEGIDYRSASDLPSEHYADASHPLKEGYAIIAEELFETESFRQWMEERK